jgi:hypothetical protein
MRLKDLLKVLHREGVTISDSQIRWAIARGTMSWPPRGGSLRFIFGEDHLKQLRQLFGARPKEADRC